MRYGVTREIRAVVSPAAAIARRSDLKYLLCSRYADHDRLAETLLWLCAIASPIGEEKALCDAVEKRITGQVERGAPDRRFAGGHGSSQAPEGRASCWPATSTSFAPSTTVRRASRATRLFGPGAADMKSGLAVMLELLDSGFAERLGVDLTLVFYAREEGPFAENELGPVLEQAQRSDRSVDPRGVPRAFDNKLQLGATGSLHAQVTFQGRTAHSARPWQGENAIHKAGAVPRPSSAVWCRAKSCSTGCSIARSPASPWPKAAAVVTSSPTGSSST